MLCPSRRLKGGMVAGGAPSTEVNGNDVLLGSGDGTVCLTMVRLLQACAEAPGVPGRLPGASAARAKAPKMANAAVAASQRRRYGFQRVLISYASLCCMGLL
jgi:hypothetical protein